ncbi:MAG: acyl-CoA thioesterase [Parvibaculales bacterium]
MSERPTPHHRQDYKHFQSLQTRWQDNDIYGHVNNAVYYAFFDKIVNDFLIERSLIDIQQQDLSKPVGLVVETGCHYFAPISYPHMIDVGLRVQNIGKSSVHYEIGVFASDVDTAIAQGKFVHVYVDTQTRRPVALSDLFKTELAALK